jgi:D-glycero-D-manno-heptose 1,7-bisphosphate phosphatase
LSDPHLIDGVGLWCDVVATARRRRALFLDRDGVIVEEVHYLKRPEDVRLIPGAAAAIAACNRAGLAVVIVTNQAGIGRGLYTWRDFALVQQCIVDALGREGASVDAVLACAYHADGQGGLRVADHGWRKPRPGMILAAADRMGLDLSRAWIVGDRAADLAAGRAAGLAGGTLVETGYGTAERGGALALSSGGFAVTFAADLAAAVTSPPAAWPL